MRSSLVTIATGVLFTACAGGSAGSGPAAAPAPAPAPAPTPAAAPKTASTSPAVAPAAATVMKQAAQAEPPKPKDVDPSGMFAVSLTYGGAPLTLTLQIAKRSDGTFGGAIVVDQAPQPIPLNTVAVSGKRVQATLSSPDGSEVTMDFTIEGDDLSGTWRASSGDGSPISGRKIP